MQPPPEFHVRAERSLREPHSAAYSNHRKLPLARTITRGVSKRQTDQFAHERKRLGALMEHSLSELIAREAERILDSLRHTDFESKPLIDPETGTYNVDDAAFIGHLVERCAPEEFARIPKAAHERFPRASEIYDFFMAHSHSGWELITDLAEARRGDIIAWKPSRATRGSESGHVAMVAQAPELDARTETWTVRILDSSAVAHYGDSRIRGRKYHPGVGSGALKFRVNSHGAPEAVETGPDSGFHKYQIAIVRLKDEARAKSRPPNGAASSGCRIERTACANEALGEGEFALATYVLPSTDGTLLPPTTLACWGPGQTIKQTLGSGHATYTLLGSVVFRNF